MKKKYYYGSPVVVFGWSTQTGDDGFEWSYTKFPDETSPEEGKEYPLSEVWDKDLVFDGIHRDNQGGTSHVEVRYLDRTALQQEGKYIADIRDAFTTGHPFKLSNGYTKYDSETDTYITYQFDKTKSYLIRRNRCSGPPKVVFLYINESGENCYKVVTVQEIRSEVNSVTENEAKLTHYHFGDWKKAEAHYELVGNIYKVDSVSDEVVTFPKEVTEFNEYYQAELVPNEYHLQFYDTGTSQSYQCFFNEDDDAVQYVNTGADSYTCIITNDTGKLLRFGWVSGNGGGGENNNPSANYQELITATITFSAYTKYIPDRIVIYGSNMQKIAEYTFSASGDSYITTFNMPGQDIIIKAYIKKV